MKRFFWSVIAVSAIFGIFSGLRFCSKEPILVLPRTAAAWTLAIPQNCIKPVPAELKVWRGTAGARSVCRAEYAGPSPMKLTIYDMPNEFASAFDAVQKWPPQPGKMGFFKGSYFGVAESHGADRETLERFVVAVEGSLPAGGEWRR